jgi:hypothetical protein
MLCFVGCSELEANTETYFSRYKNGYVCSCNDAYYLIDNTTGVVYIAAYCYGGVSVSPAYNADGTLLTKKQLEVGDTQ